jgi:hypothetical protein
LIDFAIVAIIFEGGRGAATSIPEVASPNTKYRLLYHASLLLKN